MNATEIKELIQELEVEYIWFEEIWNDYKGYDNKPQVAIEAFEMMETLGSRIQNLESHLELIRKSKQIGRPSLGVTKKVSITLPEDVWEAWENYLHESKESKSGFLRELILSKLEGGEFYV